MCVQFLATLDEILFTNVDVSSKVFSTIFTKLACHPEVQSQLQAEIQTKRQEMGESKYLVSPETLLNRVVMESMRLSPAFCKSSRLPHETQGGN